MIALLNVLFIILVNRRYPAFANVSGLVVFDERFQVFFGLHVHLLAPLLILEANHIEIVGAALGAAAGLDAALGFVVGQREGQLVVMIVHRAHNDGAIRVTVQERHHHFVSDAWNPLIAPAFTGPLLHYPNPAGILAFTVAGKAYAHAAVLIRPDLFGRLRIFVDDERRLWSANDRLRNNTRRTERNGGGKTNISVAVSFLPTQGGDVSGVLHRRMTENGQQEIPRNAQGGAPRDAEGKAERHRTRVRSAFSGGVMRFGGLRGDPHEFFAFGANVPNSARRSIEFLGIFARIVKNIQVGIHI